MWSVLLVFLSSLDRNLVKGGLVSSALDAKKLNKETFCAKVSFVDGNVLYEVSDGAEVVRSLVTSAGALVACSINGNPEQVVTFTRECKTVHKDDTVEQKALGAYEHKDEARLRCQHFHQSEKATSKDQVHRRAKRGFTYPGTLWCGAGNMADSYNQLGDFAETDSCCRTHDHCPHVIHAFSSNYGYTNFKWHSISHCDCDQALKACLRKVNDTSSRVVGQAFFNVIEAPCFTFAYEEQCIERHWYGLCKRFEERPIAVLNDAVPYDFGGIDVIDELTMAPSRKIDSNRSGEQVQSEPTSQSPMSGSQTTSPEEPSLRNVMTAAEDFIKVLATVSTSQSSTADSDKSNAQSSEKKKKKTSQKKKKTKKTKGKGRKKKQKQEAVVKIEDNGAVPLSTPKEEGATGLSNLICQSQLPEQPGRASNKVSEHEYELEGKEETSNEVMKDEPALDKEAISVSPTPVKRKAAKMGFRSSVSSAMSLHKAKTKWLRNRQRKVKTVPSFQLETTSTTSKPQERSIVSTSERSLIVNVSPIEIHKVKKNRSKLRKDGEERKKRLNVVNKNVDDNLREGNTPLTISPGLQFSQEAGGGRVHVTPLSPSYSVLKRQRHRAKEKGIAKKKRKGQSLLNEHLYQTMVEESILPTPSGAQISPAVTTAISQLMDDTQTTTTTLQLFTTNISSVDGPTKRRLNKKRGKSKNKSQPAPVSDPKPMTVTNLASTPAAVDYAVRVDSSRSPQPTTTSAYDALSTLSPKQLTIEKVKEQFERKRKRKEALFLRQ